MPDTDASNKSSTQPSLANPPRSNKSASGQTSKLSLLWQQLSSIGLAETAMRFSTHLLSIVLILVVAWAMHRFYVYVQVNPVELESGGVLAAEIPTATATPSPPDLPPLPNSAEFSYRGITRLALLHTTIPTRQRLGVDLYTVQPGDTVFDIAEKFGLRPETILWGNYHILADDPHRLKPGQDLNILPVDGTHYQWQAGDGLNGVASFYGVQPEEIINWPSNGLSLETVGDYANPKIEPGTWLVIPGGRREFVTWSAPRITRSDPGVAKVLGPGNCGAVLDGPVGIGAFVWPANNHFISGYDYSPATNHYGIDIDGDMSDPIYAADNGVVVYAGWNNWGYGNMIVIDHGTGWQSLYAHLSALNVDCGSYAYQGNVIGYFGSTGNSSGPHLHFELMHDQYGKVNPWNFLP